MPKEILPDPIPQALEKHHQESNRLKRTKIPFRIVMPGMTLQEIQQYGYSIARGIEADLKKEAIKHDQAIKSIRQEFPNTPESSKTN